MGGFDESVKDTVPVIPEPENADSLSKPGESPQSQGYPQQPYTRQPYASQPFQSKPSGKLNTVSFALAVCFTVSMVLQALLNISGIVFIGGWVTHIIEMLIIGAGVLLILGICQRSKAGNMLFGVGLLAIAAGNILSILVNSYTYDFDNMIVAIAMLALNVIVPTSLTISGISYFVSNDSFAGARVIMMMTMIAVIIIRTLYGYWIY